MTKNKKKKETTPEEQEMVNEARERGIRRLVKDKVMTPEQGLEMLNALEQRGKPIGDNIRNWLKRKVK